MIRADRFFGRRRKLQMAEMGRYGRGFAGKKLGVNWSSF